LHTRIADLIRNYNKVSISKIKYRKRKYDCSLYLEIRRDGKRFTQNLEGLSLSLTSNNYTEDKATVEIARKRQTELDIKYKMSRGNIKTVIQDQNFIDYFNAKHLTYEGNTKLNWQKSLKHLKDYSGKVVRFKDVDKKFCDGFVEYLKDQGLHQNSIGTYMNTFKRALNLAIEDELLEKNPANHIHLKRLPTKREFLTVDEVKTIAELDFYDERLKNAFIFSCYTGLRFSDIKRITFEDIHSGHLSFIQQKTKDPLRIPLHAVAKDIIERQREINGLDKGNIFALPCHEVCRSKMKKMIKAAGINKNITFHSARHTFATLCLTFDIPLNTVKELLGHKDIRNTQIYAQLIDKKKDEAIDKLPGLDD